MGLTIENFTLRQTMQDSLFECHHYLDKVPPEVEFHEHEFYEIYFFLSGAVSYVIEGRTYQLRPGDILLTNNEDIHRPEVREGKPYERYVIWIRPEAIQSFRSLGDDLAACFLDAANRRFIWFVFGMHWAMDLGYIVMGIVADLVAGMRSYKNTKWNIAAFALFCLGPAGVFLAYSINPTAWAQIMLEKGTSQEYIDIMANSAPIGMLPVILLGTVVIAIVSGLIGRKLLKKQFEKAGITA